MNGPHVLGCSSLSRPSRFVPGTSYGGFSQRIVIMVCSKPFFVLLAFLSIGALALPEHPRNDRKGNDHKEFGYSKDCLTDSEARFLVDTWNYFFIRFDPRVVEQYLAPDFHEFSDSHITLFTNGPVSPSSQGSAFTGKLNQQVTLKTDTAQKPLGSPVSASRDEFIQNHIEDPIYPEGTPNWFRIEEIFHTCTMIGFRWMLPPEGEFSMGPLPIRGNDIMYTTKRDGK